jgi:Xaa-Pro aminopeptidase
MKKQKVIKALIITFVILSCLNVDAQNYKDLKETQAMIRYDRFDYILPDAMRNNQIDMWIIIDKGRGTEPLYLDFGDDSNNGNGLFIFTDRGGDRIERANLSPGHTQMEGRIEYDIFGEASELRAFVEERNPKTIAINYTTDKELFPMEGRHLSDGISHTDYLNLKKELGKKYGSRLVSAERLIADYRAQKVPGEIIEFSKIAFMNRELQERALSNEVITVGKTTQLDVCNWLDEQRHDLGFESGWYPTVFMSPADGNEIANTNRVIQPGDVLQIDWGIGKHNYHTDMKRFSYVLADGETEVPAYVQNAFSEAKKVREIIRENVKSGRTGREILDDLKQIMKDNGYVYTDEEHASNIKGIEVNIGMHPTGDLGHGVGASMFEIYPARTNYTVQPNSLIAFEFIVFTPAAEWGGNKVPVCIEENALITEKGIQWVHPPQNEILIIR